MNYVNEVNEMIAGTWYIGQRFDNRFDVATTDTCEVLFTYPIEVGFQIQGSEDIQNKEACFFVLSQYELDEMQIWYEDSFTECPKCGELRLTSELINGMCNPCMW